MHIKLTAKQIEHAKFNTRYPMTYATPCFFGNPESDEIKVNNGTATLIEYENDRYAITNHHVLKCFRERSKSEKLHFFLGNSKLKLDDIFYSESEDYDLAVLYLGDIDKNDIKLEGNVPTEFFPLEEFSIGGLKTNDFVMFGGYPSLYREQPKKDVLVFDTLSSGASEVDNVSMDVITATVQLEKCIVTSAYGKEYPEDLGGLSGGPVFIEETNGSILTHRLIGIIYQYGHKSDILLIRPANLLEALF